MLTLVLIETNKEEGSERYSWKTFTKSHFLHIEESKNGENNNVHNFRIQK